MKSRETARSRIFGSRSTTNGVPRNLRKIKLLVKRHCGFTGSGATIAADNVFRVTLLEEATEPFEELGIGRLEILSLFAGASMMSSKLCFLLACDAGMMPIALVGRTTGRGGVSSRG